MASNKFQLTCVFASPLLPVKIILQNQTAYILRVSKMSKLKCEINYKSLELELQEALRADELYKLQNDTKIRAVEQNVPTYEDFRQMVITCSL